MESPLKRGMTVRLVDRTAIDSIVIKYPHCMPPRVELGERGVISKSEGEVAPDQPTLAECKFADCTLYVDRSMVELA
jgi:hypothetical protein